MTLVQHEYFGRAAPGNADDRASTIEERVAAALRPVADSVGLAPSYLADSVARDVTRRPGKAAFDHLASLGVLPQSLRILDMGAGLGQTSVEAVLRGGEPVAVEPGSEWCAVVAARLAEVGNHAAVVADGERLPFPDGMFDLVMSVAVLEHVRRPIVYLREAFRVLKPGGHMYLSCENYLSFWEPHYQVAWLPLFPKPLASIYLKARGRPDGFLRNSITYTTRPSVIRNLRRCGFEFVQEESLARRLEGTADFKPAWKRGIVHGLRRVMSAHALARAIFGATNLRHACTPYFVTVVRKPQR